MPTTPSRTDALRAGLMGVLNAFFPMLILLDVLHWSSEQLAGVMLFLNALVAFGFLMIPAKTPPTV